MLQKQGNYKELVLCSKHLLYALNPMAILVPIGKKKKEKSYPPDSIPETKAK